MAQIRLFAEVAGNVWKVVRQKGEEVGADDAVLILESMKMEIPVAAPARGRVAELYVKEGDVVKEGEPIAVLDID
jgi:acetyl-CoA carboxylase biotin carboxyl carrier protein